MICQLYNSKNANKWKYVVSYAYLKNRVIVTSETIHLSCAEELVVCGKRLNLQVSRPKEVA